jgi:hypothetical protein
MCSHLPLLKGCARTLVPVTDDPKKQRSRRTEIAIGTGAVTVQVSILVNLFNSSASFRALALLVVVSGLLALSYWVRCLLVDTVRSMTQQLTESLTQPLADPLSAVDDEADREARLARLNRLAAENKELLDAMGKVVVPIAVALVAFAGGILALVFARG